MWRSHFFSQLSQYVLHAEFSLPICQYTKLFGVNLLATCRFHQNSNCSKAFLSSNNNHRKLRKKKNASTVLKLNLWHPIPRHNFLTYFFFSSRFSALISKSYLWWSHEKVDNREYMWVCEHAREWINVHHSRACMEGWVGD